MQTVGGADIQDIKFQTALEQFLDISKKGHLKILCTTSLLASWVNKCHELSFCIAANHLCMALADVSGANYGKFYSTHLFYLRFRSPVDIFGHFLGK